MVNYVKRGILLAWSVSIIEATNGGEGLNFVYVINYIDE